jgi:hypothetical protein
MVDAIVRACADAHARTSAELGKVKNKGKGDSVPSVRREDIVRSVFFSFSFPLFVPFTFFLLLTYLWLATV